MFQHMSNGIIFNDMFGDIQIVNNDIRMEYDRLNIIIQNIAEHLKTDLGDYFFYPKLGANLSQFKGLPIDDTLLNEIELYVTRELGSLNLLTRDDIEVIAVRSGDNTIHIRVVLYQDDEYTIKLNIDPSLGVTIGY